MRYPTFLKAVFIFILFINGIAATAQDAISNYKVYFAEATYKNSPIIIIRKLDRQAQACYFSVDPNTLETQIIAANLVTAKPLTWAAILVKYKTTPYIKALLNAQQQSFALQDAGIIHGFPKEKGITLTIDLCPSHKPLDRVVFTSLITEFGKIEKPVPVALSITGRFMLTHPEDINWLKNLVKSGDITITWINHTYNHHYNPKAPLTNNFLLEPGTDLSFEILGTEIALLQQKLQSSVFFRFPGLVSDNRISDSVIGYGLIPIGSDAWLAKGQQANAGSIVLIHGNGNEPLGVKDFIALLKSQQSQILGKQWLMYDLRESVEDEFKE